MSSRASRRTLEPGEHTLVTNDTPRPVELVLQTGGSTIRATLAIGAAIDLAIGQGGGTLYLFEPEEMPERLRIVKPREAPLPRTAQ